MPEAVDLWVAAWSRAMPEIDFEARRAWFVDHLAALRGKGCDIICAFRSSNGEMAGFITHEKPGQIDQLCVAVDAWGSGAAGVLLNEVKRLSGGHLALDVNRDNPRAVRFYEREGFCRVGQAHSPSGLATWRYEWVDISRVG